MKVPSMKKTIFSLSLLTCITIFADENPMKQTFETYRNTKAFEAIVYDNYQETQPMEHVPEAYTNAVKKMGLSPAEVKFYTAIRMDRFVEKVGNCIVILRPNFFLYLTEEEQVAHIAVQLARIKDGDLSELPHFQKSTYKSEYDKPAALVKKIDMASKIAIAGALGCCYRTELYNAAMASLPYVEKGLGYARDLICSKTGAFIGACTLANIIARMRYTQNKVKELTKYELATIDAIGADGLIKTRERQVNWGKINCPWTYQWYVLMGKLGLEDCPEVQLESYRKHLEEKSQR